MDTGSKTCLQCEEKKQISEFQLVGAERTSRRNICRQCFNYNQRMVRKPMSDISDLINNWPRHAS